MLANLNNMTAKNSKAHILFVTIKYLEFAHHKMLPKKLIGIALVALMCFGVLQALHPVSAATPSTGPKNGGTFILGTTEDELVTDQNPLTASGLSGDILGITYADTLAYVFQNNGTSMPWMASSWNITDGGTALTFNLVHNAYWMNGTQKAMQFTSKDVLFTFNVLKANSTLDVNGVFPAITNISAPNSYTVVFKLNAPNPTMFDYIASQTIIPHTWAAYEPNLSDIGSYTNMQIGHQLSLGPMVLQNISTSSVTMVANPFFFKGAPHFSKEVLDLYESSSSMVEALESGSIDATYVDPNNLYGQINNYTGLKAVAFKTPFNLALWFNDKVAPYNNTDFRIGLSYAINYTAVLSKAEDNLGGPVNLGGLPWTLSSYYNSSVGSPTFNYTKANYYFRQAGLHQGSNGKWDYANGTAVSLSFVDLNEADWDTAMTLMQSELQADNLSVSFKVVPTQVWATDIFSTPNFTQASFFNFGPLLANPWFALWAEYSYNGYWNFEGYNNQTVNHLFNVSLSEKFNSPAFNKTLDQIQGIVADQRPTIPVMGAEVYYGYATNKVAGFYPDEQLISPLDSLYAYSLHPPTNNNTIYYIIGGVAAAVVIIGVVGGLVVSKRKRAKE